MQTTWYLFPGQTLQNTAIEDRGKALIAPAKDWKRITDQLDAKEEQERLLFEHEKHRQAIKEESHSMTKNWYNSIEQIQERLNHALENKHLLKEKKLVDGFTRIREDQKCARDRIVEEARKKAYMIKEPSQTLNGALLLSEVLYERDLQQKVKLLEIEHEKMEVQKEALVIKQNAIDEQLRKIENAQKKRVGEQEYGALLKEQIKAIEDKKHQEITQKHTVDRTDNIKANIEIKKLAEHEKKLERELKQEFKKQFDEFNSAQKRYKNELQIQALNEQKIINIYEKAKCRIEAKKKQKELEMRQEMVKIRENISAQVTVERLSTEGIEERMIEKALKERDEREENRFRKEEELRKNRIKAQKAYREEVVKRKQKEEMEQKERKKYELLNNMKANEVMKKYDEDRAQREMQDKLQYRNELLKQINEHSNKEKEICEDGFRKQIEENDKEYFKYADEVLHLASSRGRSIKPILQVIEKYKKENNLLQRRKEKSSLIRSG